MSKATRYAYKIKDGEVYVTPVEYRCMECGFCTTSQEEEQKHYYIVGHFLQSTLDPSKIEEWTLEKHGSLPIASELLCQVKHE